MYLGLAQVRPELCTLINDAWELASKSHQTRCIDDFYLNKFLLTFVMSESVDIASFVFARAYAVAVCICTQWKGLALQ